MYLTGHMIFCHNLVKLSFNLNYAELDGLAIWFFSTRQFVPITAHGGLSRDGRYLRSIRDDAELVASTSALAGAVARIELVILFVCSGGRIDMNPWDNSTTSLPKQLLNRGSRAVIASSWPLNVLVTYNWLEPFLTAWEEGLTVIDATKKANERVAECLGDVPQYFLAMRVYGDVLLTRAE